MNKLKRNDVVQFNENHKWRGSLGFVVEIKECGDDRRVMICCTAPNNQTSCDSIYIYSMLSKHELEPLPDGHVVLAPEGE